MGHVPVAAQDDDFRRAGVSTDADLGVQTIGAFRPGVGQDNDAAGVFPAGFIGCLDGFFFLPGLGHDNQRQDPAQGNHAALFAQGHDLLGDLGGGGIGKIYDHGLLQVRPSRASRASADAGPQLPGA
ncbi:hypothetical protein PJL18_00523 [Paenarthrobacter nicotinovorans]|nr:hypothetical protein [Paenarthrobacter nicotinovorans]